MHVGWEVEGVHANDVRVVHFLEEAALCTHMHGLLHPQYLALLEQFERQVVARRLVSHQLDPAEPTSACHRSPNQPHVRFTDVGTIGHRTHVTYLWF